MKRPLIDLKALGSGYVEIVREREGKLEDGTYKEGRPIAMFHLPSAEMRILRDRSGFVQQKGARTVHFRNFLDEPRLDPGERTGPDDDGVMTEVIDFQNYDPGSPYYGLPDIVASMIACRAAVACDWWNFVFFSRYAVPELAVKIVYKTAAYDEDSIADVVETLKGYFEFELKGEPHQTMILEIPDGIEITFESLAKEQREGQFRTLRGQLGLEIARANRVPPNRIGIFQEAGGTVEGNDAQLVIYKNSVIKPVQEMIESVFFRLIQVGFGFKYWRFKFDEIDAEDEEVDATIANTLSGIWAITPNEVRKKLGLEPYKSALFDLPKDLAMEFIKGIMSGAMPPGAVKLFIERGTLMLNPTPPGTPTQAGGSFLGAGGLFGGGEMSSFPTPDLSGAAGASAVPGQAPVQSALAGSAPVGFAQPAVPTGMVTDFATGQPFRDSAEEQVRQVVEHDLVERYGYDKRLLGVEYPVRFGTDTSGRADIVVFADVEHKRLHIIVEVKSPDERTGIEQLKTYMNATGTRFGLWANNAQGKRIAIERYGEGGDFRRINDIPNAVESGIAVAPTNGSTPTAAAAPARRPIAFERVNRLQGINPRR
jgi:type I restriction enzyme M protein